MRLPRPGGPGPRIHIPQEQGGPVIPPGTRFPFRHPLQLAGLRWRYSNRTASTREYSLSHLQFKFKLIETDSQSASSSWCHAPFGVGGQMFISLSANYFFLFFQVGRPLWRGGGSVICSAMTQVQLQVILRPTVCRPVRLGVGPPMTRF
jgi:hypothetical protein